MKNLLLPFTLPLFLLAIQAQADEKPAKTGFTLNGEIEGLVPGDTIKLYTTLPGGGYSLDFLTVVDRPGKFTITGDIDHTQVYLMNYRPLSGIYDESQVWRLDLMIRPGDVVKVEGTVGRIYGSLRSGGVFDDPLLQERFALVRHLNILLSDAFSKRNEAIENNDSLKVEYDREFFAIYESEDYKRMEKLREDFAENVIDSEWRVYQIIDDMGNETAKRAQAKFDRLTPEVRGSHYGKILAEMIEAKKNEVLPGAPDFNLAMADGSRATLKDFKDSYLLIYKWGSCPGSFQTDAFVQEIFHKYKDRNFGMIGITYNIDAMRQWYEIMPPEEQIGGKNGRTTLEGMLSHPWRDADITEENRKFIDDYDLQGLPMFVFISPQGELISKGYGGTLDMAVKILEDEFGAN